MIDRKPTAPETEQKVIREFRVKNQYGIHARPAALLVKTASAFQSDISIEKAGMRVSAKSIMGLLTIEGHQHAVLRVIAKGVDAEEAIAAIGKLFKKGFYEQ